MTYKELIENLSQLNDEALSKDVTVYVSGVDEFFGLRDDFLLPLGLSGSENDVLDGGTPYLII